MSFNRKEKSPEQKKYDQKEMFNFLKLMSLLPIEKHVEEQKNKTRQCDSPRFREDLAYYREKVKQMEKEGKLHHSLFKNNLNMNFVASIDHFHPKPEK